MVKKKKRKKEKKGKKKKKAKRALGGLRDRSETQGLSGGITAPHHKAM